MPVRSVRLRTGAAGNAAELRLVGMGWGVRATAGTRASGAGAGVPAGLLLPTPRPRAALCLPLPLADGLGRGIGGAGGLGSSRTDGGRPLPLLVSAYTIPLCVFFSGSSSFHAWTGQRKTKQAGNIPI
eukprot:4649188-Pleurochrysis_carterae.AAC.1